MKHIVLLAVFFAAVLGVTAQNDTIDFVVKNELTRVACRYSNVTFKNKSKDVPGTVYVWNFGDKTSDTVKTRDTVLHVYRTDGKFTVELQRVDTSKKLVVGSKKKVGYVTIYRPTPSIEDPDVDKFTTYDLTFKPSKTNKPFDPLAWRYEWDFGDGQKAEEDSAREVFHHYTRENLKPGYKVILWMRLNIQPSASLGEKAIAGCYDSVILPVVVRDGFFKKSGSVDSTRIPNIPNVFTPNGDGENDVVVLSDTSTLTQNMINGNDLFYFKTNGEQTFKFWVYNRWGNLVYKTEGKTIMWLGKNNTGDDLQSGVYYYVVESNAAEKRHNKRGFIHLIRE